MTNQSKAIEEILEPEFVMAFKLGMMDALNTNKNKPTPIPALKSLQANAKQSLATELVRMVEEALILYIEKHDNDSMIDEAWCTTCDQILNEDGDCWCKPKNMAIAEARTRLTTIIERELK